MSYQSTNSKAFLDCARSWIESAGELLALVRYSRAAGSKDFELFQSFDAFHEYVASLPPEACVTIFKDPQVPLRGEVSEEFIERSLLFIGNGEEYVVISLKRNTYPGQVGYLPHCVGETHEELSADLRDHFGEAVAVAFYPPWLVDNDTVHSAVVPDDGGNVGTGIY